MCPGVWSVQIDTLAFTFQTCVRAGLIEMEGKEKEKEKRASDLMPRPISILILVVEWRHIHVVH